MGLEINTNVTSSIIQNNLALSQSEVEKSILKIATGKKLSAVEDAANLILAETLDAQARGSQTAIENSQTGINTLQTADAGLESTNENLQRIRELSVQAANGTYGEDERNAIKDEISALTDEINRVANSTSFNKQNLLDGSSSDLTLQTGPNGDPGENTINVGDALGSVKTDDLGLLNSDDVKTSLNTSDDFRSYIDSVDNALSRVTEQRSNIGAYQNRLESNINSMDITSENLIAAQSRIRDTDIASEMSKLTQNQILNSASASLLAQANQIPSIALSLI
ncbi:MAG TPA: flagellin [Cyanobacteria bacterium UBA9971]|nr:flagellin [Cyanobacteria bacterium UBA9971]